MKREESSFGRRKPDEKHSDEKSVSGKRPRITTYGVKKSEPSYKEKSRDKHERPYKERKSGKEDGAKPYERKPYGERSPRRESNDKPYERKPYGERRPRRESEDKPYERKPYGERSPRRESEDKPYERKPYSERRPRRESEGKPYERKPYGERRPRRESEGKPYERKPYGERRPRRESEDKPYERKPYGERRPRRESEDKPYERKPYGERSPRRESEDKPYERKPYGERRPRRESDDKSYERKKPEEESDSKPFIITRSWDAGDEKPRRKTKEFKERPKTRFDTKNKSDEDADMHSKKDEDGLIRLNKYLSNAGVCSRREADELIQAGAVSVNGVIITELGHKISPDDKVQYGGETLHREKYQYVLLNKPKGYITTLDDPDERKTVMLLVQDACKERIYPVGRLDRNTTGLLLFTNDGELTKKLTHPRYNIRKIYHATLDKSLTHNDFLQLTEGVELEDGFIKIDELAYVGEGKKELGLEIHSGQNRVVRRLFEHLGYDVVKLDRVSFAGLTKKDLPRGKCRHLTQQEINFLKMMKA